MDQFKEIDQHTTILKELNDKYKTKLEEGAKLSEQKEMFANQKEVVDLIYKMDHVIDRMYWLNRKMKSAHCGRLEMLCDKHEWEIDTSMWDSHTQKECKKCGKYV